MPSCTAITANNLFANMPVRCQVYQTPSKRKQILKNTEDILMSFALIHPQKRFSFMHNKCMVWQKPNCKDLQSTLENVIGSNVVAQMTRVDHNNEVNSIQLTAYIPTSSVTRHYRKSNDRCFIYVNNRPIRDKEIEKIIKQHTGADSSSSPMKWPVFFLSIEIPLDRVDSNVESDKWRVLISDKELVMKAIDNMLSEAYATIIINDKDDEKENLVEDAEISIQEHTDHNIKQMGKTDDDSPLISNSHLQNTSACSDRSNPISESPIASDWSKGHAVVDDDGSTIQPVRVLAGTHGKQAMSNKNNGNDKLDISSKPICEVSNLFNNTSSCSELDETTVPIETQEKPIKMKQSNLNMSGFKAFTSTPSPLRSSYQKTNPSPIITPSRKRKAPDKITDDIRNASLITEWASDIGSKNPKMSNCTGDEELRYLEGQEINLKYDFSEMKENLSFKEDYKFAERSPYSSIGTLKDVKAGVLLNNINHKLLLVNLLRLQESKVFWSLMENHTLQMKELSHPILLPLSSLTKEEMAGFERLKFSTPDLLNPDIECIDERIYKNGFKMKIFEECDGTKMLRICEMSNAIPYYKVDELKNILRKLAASEEVSLHETRPFKAVQYLQGEAVRMSHSLPIHSAVLESLEDLKRHFSKDYSMWNCFHGKPIFQELFTLPNHL
ncbi:PMS1 protein homolog 1-like isoform X2 [Styela clava]